MALAADGPCQHERPDADLQVRLPASPPGWRCRPADPRARPSPRAPRTSPASRGRSRRRGRRGHPVDRSSSTAVVDLPVPYTPDSRTARASGGLGTGRRLPPALPASSARGLARRSPASTRAASNGDARCSSVWSCRRSWLEVWAYPSSRSRSAAEPLELARLDGRPARGRRPHGHQREQVVEAQGRAGDGAGPRHVGGEAHEALRAACVRPRVALAGRAGGRSRGVGDAAGPAPALGGIRHLELTEAGHERRAEQDRGTQRSRPPPVRLEHRRDVPRAEPARGVEGLAERDVVDALGQDRLEVGVLGSLALPAQRAAGRAERVGEVHVRARADGQPGSLGAAHRAIVRVDDGTGWVWDLPVMSVDAPAANNRPQP